jgi:hypothetical protein
MDEPRRRCRQPPVFEIERAKARTAPAPAEASAAAPATTAAPTNPGRPEVGDDQMARHPPGLARMTGDAEALGALPDCLPRPAACAAGELHEHRAPADHPAPPPGRWPICSYLGGPMTLYFRITSKPLLGWAAQGHGLGNYLPLP